METRFRHFTSLDLATVYIEYAAKGHARGRDGVLPGSLEEDIFDTCEILAEKIAAGVFKFTQYRERLILKGAGRNPRVISIPTARDRIVIKAMALFLAETFPELRPELPQQKVNAIQESLKDQTFKKFVRTDIKDFYPSIRHELLLEELSTRVSDPQVLRLFQLAIETSTVADGSAKPGKAEKGVPQGLAISNLLAELTMRRVDGEMKADPNAAYFRYVDDILVLSRDESSFVLENRLKRLAKDVDLDLNLAKTSRGATTGKFEYLGYVFDGDRLSVRDESVAKIERSLAKIFTKYKYGRRGIGDGMALKKLLFYANLRITGCIFDGGARGWIQYFRQTNDERLINKLDWVVGNLRKRFLAPPEASLKTFTRAYWAVKHPGSRNGNYIPNFDEWTESRKRDLLIDLGVDRAHEFSDSEVQYRFRKVVGAAVSDLENDIGSLS